MPIQPAPSPPPMRSPRPQVLFRPSVPNLPIVPVIYAPSYAPAPFINYIQPTPRIFTHAPVFTAPPPVTPPASQERRILTPPISLDRQSPHSRIAPSPTLSSISTVSTDTDTVSKIKFSVLNFKNHKT